MLLDRDFAGGAQHAAWFLVRIRFPALVVTLQVLHYGNL